MKKLIDITKTSPIMILSEQKTAQQHINQLAYVKALPLICAKINNYYKL